MSERATIRDFEANEELDAELQKKCAEIFMALDENKIDYKRMFNKYYLRPHDDNVRLNCTMRIFEVYDIVIHINADKTLYASTYQSNTENISKFDIEELIKRCVIIRSFGKYCNMYINSFVHFGRSVNIKDSAGDWVLYIAINENYDDFNFTLGKYATIYITSDNIELIFDYLCANHKELMKPRFLNTKPAKLY